MAQKKANAERSVMQMTSLILNEYGMTEKKGVPVVSSRLMSERFHKQHAHVLRDIEKELAVIDKVKDEINQSKFGEINFLTSHYKDDRGRKQPEYLLTRDGFLSIAFKYEGKLATKIRLEYINAFNQMEFFIKNLLEAKCDFPEFTDAIMSAHEEPKHYHFSNELDMINRIVLGMSAKQFREAHGIESGKSIRPHLAADQIEAVKALQRIDIGLIITIPNYEQRKGILEQQFLRIGQRRLTA